MSMVLHCPSCGSYEYGDNDFCTDCGVPLDSVFHTWCDQCGDEIEDHWNYCGNCGADCQSIGE